MSHASARGPALSVVIHAAAIVLLLLAGASAPLGHALHPKANPVALIAPYLPAGRGGGGGGDRSVLPASAGRLPRIAPRQFTPPSAAVRNPNPILPMEPTIVLSADVTLPPISLANLGDPLGKLGPSSNGPGAGGGIGDGDGSGVGPGKGPGYGPGEGGDAGGGIRGFHAGGKISGPVLIFKVEPEFSEDARKAKLQGIVVLAADVDVHGHLQNVRVVRSLGLGLDDKAIEAVKKWLFRPGYQDGRPITSAATIEVNFHLL